MPTRKVRVGVVLVVVWFGALGMMWGVSYWRTGGVSKRVGGEAAYFLSSHEGGLFLGSQTITPGVMGTTYRGDVGQFGLLRITQDGNTATAMSFDPHWMQKRFLGFGKSRWRGITTVGGVTYNEEANVYGAPWWAVMVVAGSPGVVPGLRVVRERARRRGGRCVRCGYDLRGGGGRCPECGEGMGVVERVMKWVGRGVSLRGV